MRKVEAERLQFHNEVVRYPTERAHKAAIQWLKDNRGRRVLRCPSCQSWMFNIQEWCGFCRHVL